MKKLRSAVYLIPQIDHKILLLKRFNTGYEDGNYSFIAGHVEIQESPTEAIIREAYEEAGILVKREDLQFIHVLYRQDQERTYVDFFFTTKKWQGEIYIKEPNKCSELEWFPVNDLPANTINYIKELIDNWDNNYYFNELNI